MSYNTNSVGIASLSGIPQYTREIFWSPIFYLDILLFYVKQSHRVIIVKTAI